MKAERHLILTNKRQPREIVELMHVDGEAATHPELPPAAMTAEGGEPQACTAQAEVGELGRWRWILLVLVLVVVAMMIDGR